MEQKERDIQVDHALNSVEQHFVTGHLLVVEDDLNLGYLLMESLHDKGFTVTLAATGTEAVRAIANRRFDLSIIDVTLPDHDGFAVAGQLQLRHPGAPFIFLTARSQERDRLKGFELGAEDYVPKPFSFKELYYRIQVILRRGQAGQSNEDRLSLGPVTLHPTQRILTINGAEHKLSQREAGLLQLLLQHPGVYITRTEVLKQLWGRDDYFAAKSMDVYLTRIRKLLRQAPGLELENLYGNGYRIRNVL